MSSKLLWLFLFLIFSQSSAERKLQLVQVLTSNTYYESTSIYESILYNTKQSLSDAFNYDTWSTETENIPNSMKMDIFKFGEFLRDRYGKFIGDIYTEECWKMYTTEYPVSMIAALLINAGMWPPAEAQKWNDNLDWQPIPYDYVEKYKDTVLLGSLCINFKKEVDKLIQDDNILSEIAFKNISYIVDHIRAVSNLNIKNPQDIQMLYHLLKSMELNNMTLPAWAKDMYPHGTLETVALEVYTLLSVTSVQKQLNGGSFLKTLLKNADNHFSGNQTNKMMVYSGDDRNVVGVLRNLNMWSPHILEVSASLLFEFYVNEDMDNRQEIELVYYPGINTGLPIMHLPITGCDDNCTLDKFRKLIFDVIPDNEEILCGPEKLTLKLDENKVEGSSANKISLSLTILSILMIPTIILQYRLF